MTPSAKDIERFRRLVARDLGFYFDAGKQVFLGEVLSHRASARGIGVDAYLATAEASMALVERRALARELTVSETFFFRDRDQFQALREIAIPARVRARSLERRLRILCAGCASGEEPYSISMVLHDWIAETGWDVSIVGIDVNPSMLEQSAKGQYGRWALRETSNDVQRRYFTVEGAHFVLDETIRRRVTFEERNLVDDDASFWRPNSFDIVFCRNVLMYFAPSVMKAVVARIARALAPEGFLFLGHAETLRGVSEEFDVRSTHGTFYYRRRTHPPKLAEEIPAEVALPPIDPTFVSAPGSDSWVDAIRQASDRVQVLTNAWIASGGSQTPAPMTEIAPSWSPSAALELLREDRLADARALLGRVPPESTRSPQVLLLRAVLSTYGGDLASTKDLCRELLHHDETSAGAHYLLALSLEHSGDLLGAANHDQLAAELDHTFALPHLHLGLLAGREGNKKGARRELQQALALLYREDPDRLLLFGGGFSREALMSLCRAQLSRLEGVA